MSRGHVARLVLHLARASLSSQMQYRVSFVLQSLSGLAITGVDFLALWILFERFGSVGGWKLPETALLYGMVNVSFALADGTAGGFDRFSTLVRTGELDRMLLRPLPVPLQVAVHEITIRRVGRLVQGALVLAWAAMSVRWTLARAALLAAAILGGMLLFYGIIVIQATIAFWTTEPLEVMNVLTYGGVETAQYPLSVYRPWFRAFFTAVVPLACVNWWPAHAILGRPIVGLPAWLPWAAPLAGPVFLAVSLRLFALGLDRYASTGS